MAGGYTHTTKPQTQPEIAGLQADHMDLCAPPPHSCLPTPDILQHMLVCRLPSPQPPCAPPAVMRASGIDHTMGKMIRPASVRSGPAAFTASWGMGEWGVCGGGGV